MQRKILAAVFIAFITFSTNVTAQTKYEKPSDIPAEVFAALPTFSNAKLSPSGESIGYLITKNGRTLLIIHSLSGGPAYEMPPGKKAEIRTFYWLTEDTVLLKLDMALKRVYFRGTVHESHLVAYNLKTRDSRWLGRPEKLSVGSATVKQRPSQFEGIVDFLPKDPDHILISLDLELDGRSKVYRANIHNGHRRLVKDGNDGVQNWYTDQNGEVRLGTGFKTKGFRAKGTPFAKLKDANGDWINLKDAEWYNSYDVERFTADPNVIYVTGPSEFGTKGLFKLDLNTGKIIETVFARENADLNYVISESKTEKLIGVAYRDSVQKVEYFDPFYASLQSNLNNAFSNSTNHIVAKAQLASQYLILSKNSQNPGTYYLYDQNGGQLSALAHVRDNISPSLMATVTVTEIPTRDGSHIEGFITTPKNWQRGHKLPFLILPHGGPAGHDTAEWDWMTQFYASRGYGVMQPNFRGSTGYGEAFKDAGKKQWGGIMQHDISDATKWLIEEGIADPQRICIAGMSYGGYAALMGAIQEPDLYQCSISINGVVNLPSMKDSDKKFIGARSWITDMGLEGVKDELVSPYHQAGNINIPVLLIAAKNDARVPYGQSKSMQKRLKKLQKKSKFVSIKDGGHTMNNASARLKILQETEKFLKEHIGQ